MYIVGIGEIVWDLLPEGARLGGAPLNFACHARLLGAEAAVISAVGADKWGRDALEKARKAGVSDVCVQVNELPTGTVSVDTSDPENPRYTIVENVAWDAIACTSEALAAARAADVLCWGSLAQRSVKSRETILRLVSSAAPSCKKVFDINIRPPYVDSGLFEPSLKMADILKINEDELPFLAKRLGLEGEPVPALFHRFPNLELVIHTCGAAYSEIFSPEGSVSRLDTPKVKLVDPVGAGDSFTAAFITSYLQDGDIRAAHRKAVEVSAEVCTHPGALPC